MLSPSLPVFCSSASPASSLKRLLYALRTPHFDNWLGFVQVQKFSVPTVLCYVPWSSFSPSNGLDRLFQLKLNSPVITVGELPKQCPVMYSFLPTVRCIHSAFVSHEVAVDSSLPLISWSRLCHQDWRISLSLVKLLIFYQHAIPSVLFLDIIIPRLSTIWSVSLIILKYIFICFQRTHWYTGYIAA